MRKKSTIKKWYLIGISSVILFFCIVIGVCAYFYTENKKLELQQQQEKQIEKEKQKNDRLYLTYISIENIPFLADEINFVQEYEKYIKEELKLPKVSISIFFSNYEQLSQNVYLLYSQINDTNSTVLQTVVNVSHHEYEFDKCSKKFENIEELGGVVPGGETSLSSKYEDKKKEEEYATVKFDLTVEKQQENVNFTGDMKNVLTDVIQRYAVEKYKETDVKVTEIKLTDAYISEEYQIYVFTLEDLIKSNVAVYCDKNGKILFTMEI